MFSEVSNFILNDKFRRLKYKMMITISIFGALVTWFSNEQNIKSLHLTCRIANKIFFIARNQCGIFDSFKLSYLSRVCKESNYVTDKLIVLCDSGIDNLGIIINQLKQNKINENITGLTNQINNINISDDMSNNVINK